MAAVDLLIDLWDIRDMAGVRAAVGTELERAGFDVRGPRVTMEEYDGRLMRIDARTYDAIETITGREWSEAVLSAVYAVDGSTGGRVEVFNLDRPADVVASR